MGVEKHLRLTGISTVSWKDAITSAITETAKTIDYLTNVTIISQWAKLNGKKIIEYYAEIDITFAIDRDRDE